MQHLKGEAHKLGIGNVEMEREEKEEEPRGERNRSEDRRVIL